MSNVTIKRFKINNCGICSPVDDETKLIQDALFDKLLAEK